MLNNRITKGITAAGVATLVALGSVAVAGAQEGPSDDAERKGYVGTVSSYDGSTLVVETTNPEVGSATLAVTDDTIVKTPGNELTAGALEEGARVAVLGVLGEDGTWTALQILVKPISPLTSAISGAVISREGGVITIQLPNGETRELEVGEGGEAPEVGDVITAFARDDDDDADGIPTVTGLERADQIRDRLEGFLQQADSEDESGLPPSVAAAREEVAARLGDVIERLGQVQQDILERAAANENIPDEAKAQIRAALDTARARIQEARDRVGDILDRIGPPAGRGGQPDDTPAPSETPGPSVTPGPSATPGPSGTPEPSATPSPANTPIPPNTPTPPAGGGAP